MREDSRVFVAGHRGLAGSAIVRELQRQGYGNLLLRSHQDLDLRDQGSVDKFFAAEQPQYVFLAAARVGGILANSTRPAEFLYDNLAIETNVIHSAWRHGVRKLLFLGSSCIYPKLAAQPISEDSLLTGSLEPTNEWYAVAKIAGIKMAQAYHAQYGFAAISLMPANLYGPGDNFDLQSSHVLPALIRKLHEAKTCSSPEVVIWGTGTPRREFLYVDDLASAAVFLMLHYDQPEIINVGTGEDLMISELAGIVQEVVDYRGKLVFDATMPDGTPRKVLNISRLRAMGWEPRVGLREGIARVYRWFQEDVRAQ